MIRKILHINIESMYDFISMGSSFLKKLKLNPGYFRMTMKLLTRLKRNTQLLSVRYGFQQPAHCFIHLPWPLFSSGRPVHVLNIFLSNHERGKSRALTV